jgi:hypothetical protein
LLITAVLLTVMAFVGSLGHPEAYAAAGLAVWIASLWLLDPFRAWLDRVDWRLGAILLATVVSLLGTLVVYAFGLGRDPSSFFGAAFASWAGSIAFFTVVGAGVAIVSLARPEEEPFEARARILFRRKSGLHIDYIVNRIKEVFEHYSELNANRIIIQEFHEGEKKYRVALESTLVIRSYIDDIKSKYASRISVKEVTSPPTGQRRNRLVYLRIDKVTKHKGEEFDNEFNLPFDAIIEPDSVCEIKHMLKIWMNAGSEESKKAPIRYTQKMTLEFDNQLREKRDVTIQLSRDNGQSWQDLHLPSGSAVSVLEAADLEPMKQVYAFRIAPLSPTAMIVANGSRR